MGEPGPLALVGGDELKKGNEPHDELLVRAAGGGPAFVLATAAREHPEVAVSNAVAWFGGLGLAVTELPARRRTDVTSASNAEQARSGRFFYLVGGDPGRVPKILAGTPVWDAIVAAWRNGAALAGSSAGAMALGEWTLVRARMPGDERRRYLPALGLVQRISVIPTSTPSGIVGWPPPSRLPNVPTSCCPASTSVRPRYGKPDRGTHSATAASR